MSDRYVWHDERQQFEPEPPLDIRAAYNATPPELDEILDKHACDAVAEAERIAGYEDAPLILTKMQRGRLWFVLTNEVGPIQALRILRKIEGEV